MAFSGLYLLPALAVVIVLQKSWIRGSANIQYRSRKSRRRLRARTIFLRFLVAALIVATLATLLLPVDGMSELVQGLLLTAALMSPVCLYLLVLELRAIFSRQRNAGQSRSAGSQSDSSRLEAGESAGSDLETGLSDRTKSTINAPGKGRSSAATDKPSPAVEPTQPFGQNAARVSACGTPFVEPTVHESAGIDGSTDTAESILDQTLSMDQQFDSLEELVGYHDIGVERDESGHRDDDQTGEQDDKPLETAIAMARDAMLDDPTTRPVTRQTLLAMSRDELTQMVLDLRSNKMKLQKLVIAQKSAIESEKQAHAQTRVAARDAISVMRLARDGQRVTEKIARRERSERQRLQKEYIRVKHQLDNALSTLEAHNRKKELET